MANMCCMHNIYMYTKHEANILDMMVHAVDMWCANSCDEVNNIDDEVITDQESYAEVKSMSRVEDLKTMPWTMKTCMYQNKCNRRA